MPNAKLSRFSLKRGNVKMFLFFLGFTSLLWIFIQFSKNYTQEIEAVVEYINIPEDRLLNPESDQYIKLVLNGNGFRFINYGWNAPKLQFDIKDAKTTSDADYYFTLDKEDQVLKEKLNFKGTILAVQKDTLHAVLDINLKKKIPIHLRSKIQYAPGYGSDKGVVLSFDSIMISGPFNTVDTITTIKTEKLVLEGLNTDYNSKIKLKTGDFPKMVTIANDEVSAFIGVSKFTEGNQEIPITLLNVPKGKDITIFPQEVKIVYRVGLKQYDKINAADFKVIADYTHATDDSAFIILELVNKPEFIHDVRMLDKQVQFVILNY